MKTADKELKEEPHDQDQKTSQAKQESSSSQEQDEKNDKQDEKGNNLEAKIAELNDKYLRLYSEFDNYRRRTAKEKMESILCAGEDIVKLMLPMLDDFERAIKLNENITDVSHVKEGFNLIYNKLLNTLTQKGLSPMEPLGTVFNSDLHEAITNAPVADEKLKGKVIEVIEKGYYLNGKVIRFAKVIVGN